MIALNQFATVLTSATEAVSSALNTQTRGTAVVVYNPLNIAREDVVEASVAMPAGTRSVRVIAPDGKAVPAQYENGKAIFVAKTPSVGYAVYDVEPAASAPASSLKVSTSSLENARYRVTLNADGDVSSIFDKSVNKELLSAPVRLAISHDAPRQWPAWNMDWDQVHAAPRALRRRTCPDTRGGERSGARGRAGGARVRRLPVRHYGAAGRGRCRKSRGVRQRHRLERTGVQRESYLRAYRVQYQCHL